MGAACFIVSYTPSDESARQEGHKQVFDAAHDGARWRAMRDDR